MSIVQPLLAQFPGPTRVFDWQQSGSAAREAVAIIGAVAVITLLAIVWAVYFRKRRRDRSALVSDLPRHSGSDEGGVVGSHRSHRRRRRRHARRPRNPTLSETGGLPPRRNRPPQALSL